MLKRSPRVAIARPTIRIAANAKIENATETIRCPYPIVTHLHEVRGELASIALPGGTFWVELQSIEYIDELGQTIPHEWGT